jgi:hypothetical protein
MLFIGFARVSNFSMVWYESQYYFSKHGLTTVDSVTIRKRQGKGVIYTSYLYASNVYELEYFYIKFPTKYWLRIWVDNQTDCIPHITKP